MKILGPNDTGKGILIEWDAGFINPNDKRNADIIKESYGQLDHSKPFEFYALLQKYDTPNRNGRIYPESILRREGEKYQEAIKKGLSISELNHPESSLIDLDRVSHLITDMWWEGNVLMGKIKLLTSPGFHKTGVVSWSETFTDVAKQRVIDTIERIEGITDGTILPIPTNNSNRCKRCDVRNICDRRAEDYSIDDILI